MRFDEGPMTTAQFAKWVQGFYDSGPLRPAAARARGQRDDRYLTGPDRSQTEGFKVRNPGAPIRCLRNIVLPDILDYRTGGKPVLRRPDSPFLEVGSYLLMLNAVEPIL